MHLKINSPLVSLLDLSTRDFNRLVEMTGVGYRALSGAMGTTVTTTTRKVVFQVVTLRKKSLGRDDRCRLSCAIRRYENNRDYNNEQSCLSSYHIKRKVTWSR